MGSTDASKSFPLTGGERQAYLLFTHGLSQLYYQRLPPPIPAQRPAFYDQFDWEQPFRTWGLEQWQRLGECEYAYPSGCLPWFRSLLRKVGCNFKEISQQLTAHLEKCREFQASLVVWGEADYPQLLSYIPEPPLVLTLLGRRELLAAPCLAVVGARKASAFALAQAYSLGRRLAQLGIVTVSGGAYGCDIAAHQGVLGLDESPVLAVVVFAGGLGQLYPRGNLSYFRAIVRGGGLLLSERLWGAVARPYDFPIRNRIISGLAWELVVVQAGPRSGALVTAKTALDQGREVLVLRHPSEDVRAAGSSELIADGAYAFSDGDELLAAYRFMHERSGWDGSMARPAAGLF